MGPNLGGGWDTTDWGTLDYYRAGGKYGDSGDLFPITFASHTQHPGSLFGTSDISKKLSHHFLLHF